MVRMTRTTEEQQLEYFCKAVELLGGQRATARYLDTNERQVRFLMAGDRPLHDGFLRDIAAALVTHSKACLALERRLTPAFSDNLTPQQARRQGKPDARRFDQRGTMSDEEQAEFDKSLSKGAKPCRPQAAKR